MPSFIWSPKAFTPTFKLNYGRSESGKVITKSVSIRNINPNGLTDNIIRTAINNILSAFVTADAFEYSIYEIEGSGKFNIEEE